MTTLSRTDSKTPETTLNDGMNHLLALFSGKLTPASTVNTGRMAAFTRIAAQYGPFLVDHSKESWERVILPEARPEAAVDLYREATEEQRTAIDGLMERYPNFRTYSALMESLLRDKQNDTQSFDLLVRLYDSISDIVGIEGEEQAYEITARQSRVSTMSTEELESYRAVLGVTAMCYYGQFKNRLLPAYLTDQYSADTAKLPTVAASYGLICTLRPEHAKVIADHPQRVKDIANAMLRSARILEADELELVVAGEQPVALVEGLL